jgi:AmpD protein
VIAVNPEGWVPGLRHVASPNADDRPEGATVTLAVIHSISVPPGCLSGDGVERLFTNRIVAGGHPEFDALASLRVSAHFFARRNGRIIQFVPVGRRAWHAGESMWNGRPRCNDWSIGIELEGGDRVPYTRVQYRSLIRLLRLLRRHLPIVEVVGHSDIAPTRKTDPGPFFDWSRVRRALLRR